MRSINRVAIVIRPKQAFFEWAKTLEGEPLGNPQVWCSVYLVEASEDEEPLRTLQRQFKSIFEEQLESWHRIEADWPSPRPFALFEAWFDAEVADMVFDLSNGVIEYDELGATHYVPT